MSFQQAFSPVRAFGESWRILLQAPVAMLVGGVALVILTGGDVFELEWDDSGPRLDWDELPGLLLGSVFELAACIVALGFFLCACLLALTYPRAVERVVKNGEASVSDLLSPGGDFLTMLLTQVIVGVLFVIGMLPLVVGIASAFGVGSVFGAPALGGVGAALILVVWIPAWLYVYLGVRLTEQAVALERLDPIAAIRRSWSLVRGNRWQLFVYLFVLTVFQLLGVLACIVGVFVTGTMKLVSINESYLRLVRSSDEQLTWWLDVGAPGASTASGPMEPHEPTG